MDAARKIKLYAVIPWIAGAAVFAGLAWYPISTAGLRVAEAGLLLLLWITLPALVWRWRGALLAWIVLTAGALAFLLWPGPVRAEPGHLRSLYQARLNAYLDAPYVWGGENASGIDCSGLVRKALIEALFLKGIARLDPAAVRVALWLWFHDTTARELGRAQSGQTVPVARLADLKRAGAEILPGDLAVTDSGIHVLAYLGDGRWINADPGAGKVCIINISEPGHSWLDVPMNVVRWQWLVENGGP